MATQLIDICSHIEQTLLPQHCLLCSTSASELPLCPECHADLPWQQEDCCPICALPSPAAAICGACLKSPPAFDATLAALRYQFPLTAMLQTYKYGSQLHLGNLLGRLLAEKAQHAPIPDLILAMPLHPSRLKERGFNQAVELARVVSRHLRLPLALNACLRAKETPPQTGLPLKERAKNLRGAFSCTDEVSGKRVAVVDDVMTSGASLNELAKTLKKSGTAEVHCWVVARTLAD